MVEAGVPSRPPRSRLFVEHENVLLADTHRRHRVRAAVQSQADGVLVESDRAVEVRDGEVHSAKA
jgi:hypothetical protein